MSKSSGTVYSWKYCHCVQCDTGGKLDISLMEVTPPPVSHCPTPWAVFCFQHGRVYMTNHEYNKQMNRAGDLWRCPVCGRVSEWDDDTLDAAEEQRDEREVG